MPLPQPPSAPEDPDALLQEIKQQPQAWFEYFDTSFAYTRSLEAELGHLQEQAERPRTEKLQTQAVNDHLRNQAQEQKIELLESAKKES